MKPEIIELSDADIAFPAHVIGRVIPVWEEIPSEYKDENHPYSKLAARIFFGQAKEEFIDLEPRDGIDTTKAVRMIKAALGSFEPKHEHKIAGVAYLFDTFFEKCELFKERPATPE